MGLVSNRVASLAGCEPIWVEVYSLGTFVVVMNVAMWLWFGGYAGALCLFSAVCLATTLIWSLLGAPGVERLSEFLYRNER